MGGYLCEHLADEGAFVTVTSRTPRSNQGKICYVLGNARDPAFLKSILKKKWDVIIDFMVYETPEFNRRADYLLQSTDHYIFLSSARVYADSQEPITEESPRLLDVCADSAYLATDEYALSKARQENTLFQSKAHHWTIIRPYITYGRERLQLATMEKEDWLFRALMGKKVLMTEELLAQITTMTSGLEVSSQIAAIIKSGKEAYSMIFNTVGDFEYTWQEIVKIYEKPLNDRKEKLRFFMCDREKYLRGNPGYYQYLYDRLYRRRFDNSKIRLLTTHKADKITSLSLQSCVSDFLESPTFRPIHWKLEGRRDRISSGKIAFSNVPGLKNKARYLKGFFIEGSL